MNLAMVLFTSAGVRGSRTRYSIHGRDGMGAGPDLEILPPPPPSPSPPGWDGKRGPGGLAWGPGGLAWGPGDLAWGPRGLAWGPGGLA